MKKPRKQDYEAEVEAVTMEGPVKRSHKEACEERRKCIREFAVTHPEINYAHIARTFDVSEPTVKRYCRGLGRSKGWRGGRKQSAFDPSNLWSRVKKEEGHVGLGRVRSTTQAMVMFTPTAGRPRYID